jgi:hypothetical protein
MVDFLKNLINELTFNNLIISFSKTNLSTESVLFQKMIIFYEKNKVPRNISEMVAKNQDGVIGFFYCKNSPETLSSGLLRAVDKVF